MPKDLINPEIAMPMLWDDRLREDLESVRLAMNFSSTADVMRFALRSTPGIVFEHVHLKPNEATLEEELASLSGQSLSDSGIIPPSSNFERVALLDPYAPSEDTTDVTLVRVDTETLRADQTAADLCGLNLADFAYRASKMLCARESDSPTFTADQKSSIASEDLAARKFFELTDIQPWGEENHKDFGRQDEED